MSYTSHKTLSQRFTGLAFVAAFHVAIIYLLATGLGSKILKPVEHILQTKVVDEVQEEVKEPPPPPPDLKEPPPFIPPPEISIAQEVSAAPTSAIKVTSNTVAKPAPAPTKDVVVNPKPNKRNSIPNYPPTSRRLGEVGTVTLQVYVNEEGVVSDARVAKTSGFPRLDEAAVKHVRRAWRFTPGTKNGKVAGMWITLPVRFVLN